jgi:hypothetical protein
MVRRMRRIALAVLGMVAFLGACGTPLEQCIIRANADARALDIEIAERRLALARGYRLEERLEPRFGTGLCPPPAGAAPGAPPVACIDVIDVPVTRRVPINPTIEAERIEALEAILARERARAASNVAACEAQFPAG